MYLCMRAHCTHSCNHFSVSISNEHSRVRVEGQRLDKLEASGADMWPLLSFVLLGYWGWQTRTNWQTCGLQPGGWALPPLPPPPPTELVQQPYLCLLPLWVGQAGSWLCRDPWSPGDPGNGTGKVGVLPGWDWMVGGENNGSVSLMHSSAHRGLQVPIRRWARPLVHTTRSALPSKPTVGLGSGDLFCSQNKC